MEWSDLRIFLAIARTGTLGAAARQVGQTQPTMGRRLRALESDLGQVLFQRGSGGFVLTEEGAAVLVHAERIEQEAIAVERQLAGQGAGLDGMLRVTCFDWFGVHVLPPVFAAFAAAHPGVTLELVTDQRLFSLVRREADLAFRIRPFDESELIQRKLLHVPYALYARTGTPVPVAGDGAGSTLIAMDAAFGGEADVVWLKRLLPAAAIRFRSNSRDVQSRQCAAGTGLAVLPCPLGDSVPGLVRIDLGEAPPGRDVWLGYHRDLARLVRLRALLDLTVGMLAGQSLARS
jgi:DNA-binding transcriptional LysR family regulator